MNLNCAVAQAHRLPADDQSAGIIKKKEEFTAAYKNGSMERNAGLEPAAAIAMCYIYTNFA